MGEACKHKRRPFGRGGRELPVVGLGTWLMERDDRAAAVDALRAGVDAGATHIDTAEMYGNGAVEEIVGEAIAELDRDELFIVSKVLPHNASYRGTLAACEASLRRLGTETLDCYLLHWRGSHPLAETVRAFEALREQGKIQSYGVSNFDVDDMVEVCALAGEGNIACNQVCYSVDERYVEGELAGWCAAHGVALVAYSPLGSGSFPAADSDGGGALARVADARRATPQQIALAFLAREPGSFVIPKSSQRSHVLDNVAAGALTLDADEIAAIDAAFPLRAGGGLPVI